MMYRRPGYQAMEAKGPALANRLKEQEEFHLLQDGDSYVLAILKPDNTYLIEYWTDGHGLRAAESLGQEAVAQTLIRYHSRDTEWGSGLSWNRIPPLGPGGIPVGVCVALIFIINFGAFIAGAYAGLYIGNRISSETNLYSILFALLLAPMLAVVAFYGVRKLPARCSRCGHGMRWRYPGRNFLYTCSQCGQCHISSWGFGENKPAGPY